MTRDAGRHGRAAEAALARPAFDAAGLRRARGAARDSARHGHGRRRCRCSRRRRPSAAPSTTTRSRPRSRRLRMLLYWGCGEAIRPGQPKVADTEKMSLVGVRQDDRRSLAAGALERDPQCAVHVAERARAQDGAPGGEPARRPARPWQRDARHPVRDRRQAGLHGADARSRRPARSSGPTPLSWSTIPTAQGYFLQAMGFRQNGNEMIIWTSSELQDTGWGLMSLPAQRFRAPDDRRQGGAARVVTSCTIPKGVFEGVEGGDGQRHRLRRGTEPRAAAASGRSEDPHGSRSGR